MRYHMFRSMYKLNMAGLPQSPDNCTKALARAIVGSSEIISNGDPDKILRGSLFLYAVDCFKHGRRNNVSIERAERRVKRYAALLKAVSNTRECKLINTVLYDIGVSNEQN